MKRLLAVILTIVMLLGVAVINTSADTTDVPGTVTLITNEGSPLDVEGKVTQNGETFIFTVRFDHFILIKGIDITIDAGQGIITDVKTYNLPTAYEGDVFDENWRHTRDKSQIRFVDLNITSKSRIVLTVKSPNAATVSEDGVEELAADSSEFGTQTITVSGKYADTGETLVPITTNPKDYEIIADLEEQTINAGNQPEITDGYFVPYGGVYTEYENESTFAKKDSNGNFNVEANSKYIQFKLPKKVYDDNGELVNRLSAFGAASKIEGDAWKFGCYSEYDDLTDANGETQVQHGTMVFVGDWLALKEYYIRQGNTVQQFVKAIYENITQMEQSGALKINQVDNPDECKYYVTYNIPINEDSIYADGTTPKTTQIHVYKFPRKHYIWRNFDGKLEYAIRMHGAQQGETYTSVAYCLGKTETDFKLAQISHNVKSITVPTDSNS